MKPTAKEPYVVINFGAGVQSTTLVLMWATKNPEFKAFLEDHNLPWPSAAVFADTGDESSATYRHFEKVVSFCEERGASIHKTMWKEATLSSTFHNKSGVSMPPFFTQTSTGRVGMIGRSCTATHKVSALRKYIKQTLLGLTSHARLEKRSVISLIGFSTDEAHRADDTVDHWQGLDFPLLFMGYSRQDCQNYNRALGFEPIKSACVYCPYMSKHARIRQMKEDPEGFELACQIDDRLREVGTPSTKNDLFVAREARPLRDMAKAWGSQSSLLDLLEEKADDFENCCTGHCGV